MFFTVTKLFTASYFDIYVCVYNYIREKPPKRTTF